MVLEYRGVSFDIFLKTVTVLLAVFTCLVYCVWMSSVLIFYVIEVLRGLMDACL